MTLSILRLPTLLIPTFGPAKSLLPPISLSVNKKAQFVDLVQPSPAELGRY